MRTLYELQARKVKVTPEGVNDQLFNTRDEHIIKSNHDDELLHICSNDGELLEYEYDTAREGLREHYHGRTVFPIIENFERELRLLSASVDVKRESRWIVAAYDTQMYFFGDNPNVDLQPKRRKIMDFVELVFIDHEGVPFHVDVPIQSTKQYQEMKSVIESGKDLKFRVRGMEFSVQVGKKVQNHVIPVLVEVEREDFSGVFSAVPYLREVNDVILWKDLETDTMIPTDVEAYLIMGSIFFYKEGVAPFNLLVFGSPGSGKSFHMDLIAKQCNTKNHNCEETTIKGLIWSHHEGGRAGVLYREKFVALLNEFVRIVGAREAYKSTEEARRLLSALNDAVEKKPNRARSSGLVSDSTHMMRCSLLTSDNDYRAVIEPLMRAMVNDASYMRRYSFLKLSQRTEKKGTRVAETSYGVDPDRVVEKLLQKRSLGAGRWYELMQLWRAQVSDAIEVVAPTIRNHVNAFVQAYWQEKVKRRYPFVSDEGAPVEVLNLLHARFGAHALACLTTTCIMNSTFRTGDAVHPKLTLELEDELMALKMVTRLMDDFFQYISTEVDEAVSQGVRRFGFS